MEATSPGGVALSPSGRVMEGLSEHSCHGWLEGCTLTGRHGVSATYEAVAMVSAFADGAARHVAAGGRPAGVARARA